jgi:uncharacterized damage-inducible protein DinB
MSEIRRIVNQMDRALSGDAWHGPALLSLLVGVSVEDASTHPIKGAHSIWELVLHVAAWQTIAERRLRDEVVDVTTEMDWPPVWEVSEAEWTRAVEKLVESSARLRKVAEALSDDQLDSRPPAITDSRYVLLHGVVQHNLYHAGQIAILKKAFQEKPVPKKQEA